MTAGRDGFIPPFQDLKTLSEHICVGESTIERWVKEGTFPGPVRTGKEGKRLWRWKDVEQHLAGGASADAPSADAERIREATHNALQNR